MKLKKFRIKNFKSIEDSGDCYLTDTITILAGKNESGKTSILEALECFNRDRQISDDKRPISSPDSIPEISITFIFDKINLNKTFKDLRGPLKAEADIELEVIKKYPKEYSIGQGNEKIEALLNIEFNKVMESLRDKWAKVKKIHSAHEALGGDLFEFEFIDLAEEKGKFDIFNSTIKPNVNLMEEKERERFEKLLVEIKSELNSLEKVNVTKSEVLSSILSQIPNFILFKSFEDICPNKIPIVELENNEWINDLSVISNLDVKVIKSTNDREKEKHKDSLNINLKKHYERFWTQDATNLSISWDSNHLFIWIKEDNVPFEPSLRSQGRQWHISFYVKVSARASESVPNIIMIDEPGLFLHAKAQKDVLKMLEDSAKEVQVIFSTHSPYLLEADKLNRVKLIHRTTESGTKIDNKIHALADKETLTPIMSAIGLELSDGIVTSEKVNNVIVEGPSDLYYLCAFKKLFNKNNVNFIYGGGAGNMPFVGTILQGWGAKVVYLYDNDQGRKDGVKNLKKNWLVFEDLVSVTKSDAGSIEDVFSVPDFKKYVLQSTELTYTDNNAKYVKDNKINKVLQAQNFLETCRGEEINLDEETKCNVEIIFSEIDKKFI